MPIESRVRSRAGDAVVLASLTVGELASWLSGDVDAQTRASILLVAAALPLLWRRTFPLAAPLVALGVLAASPVLVGTALLDSGAALPLVVVSGWVLGRKNERRPALVGAAAVYGLFLMAALGVSGIGVGDVVYGSMQLLAPLLVGQAVRAREVQLRKLAALSTELERSGEQRKRAALADERLRIARELHDVVAHSISVMTVQAGGARMLIEQEPARAAEALLRVEETGRHALAEMLRLPGQVRPDRRDDVGGPPASLLNLPALLEQIRQAGLPVELTVSGNERSLPAGLDLAAYRVVQEALTNTLKHAGSATASVRLCYLPEVLELEVEDDGAGSGGRGGGGGHGLVGMRERVAIYGGELQAGRRADGGFRVHALLPLERLAS
jgi:signal transduction histidine kinase